jgi:hypothetical protein
LDGVTSCPITLVTKNNEAAMGNAIVLINREDLLPGNNWDRLLFMHLLYASPDMATMGWIASTPSNRCLKSRTQLQED